MPHGTSLPPGPAATLTAMTAHPGDSAFSRPVPSAPVGPIVLGTEFGPVSTAAERVAIEQARRAGVPLLIVHGIDPGLLRLPGGRFLQRIDQARAARQAAAIPLLERVRKAGVEPQLLIWDGDPANCILEAAQAEGASRIVVGSHGRGRLGRAMMGSVSATVAGQADCPVDIVRGDGASEEIVTVGPVFDRT